MLLCVLEAVLFCVLETVLFCVLEAVLFCVSESVPLCVPEPLVIGLGTGRDELDERLCLPSILYRFELWDAVTADCGSFETFGIISSAEPIAANIVTTEQT